MDPFYVVRQEVQDGLRDLQPRLARFHALPARSPERRALAAGARALAEALAGQADALSAAVDAAARDPARFGLAAEEVDGRRRWVSSARAQLEGALSAFRAAEEGDAWRNAAAVAAAAAADDGATAATAATGSAKGAFSDPHQQMLVARQDEQLGDIEQGLERLGRIGVGMREELQGQDRLLDALGADVDAAKGLSFFLVLLTRSPPLSRSHGGRSSHVPPSPLCLLATSIKKNRQQDRRRGGKSGSGDGEDGRERQAGGVDRGLGDRAGGACGAGDDVILVC